MKACTLLLSGKQISCRGARGADARGAPSCIARRMSRDEAKWEAARAKLGGGAEGAGKERAEGGMGNGGRPWEKIHKAKPSKHVDCYYSEPALPAPIAFARDSKQYPTVPEPLHTIISYFCFARGWEAIFDEDGKLAQETRIVH